MERQNANQKFCDRGYIVAAVRVKVRDSVIIKTSFTLRIGGTHSKKAWYLPLEAP